jgi:FKBP-type peptidyl-prolyl cis-trans isomerase 2
MAKAKIGDTVKVHYTGKLDDGTVFDTSEGTQPLVFKIGEGRIIPGFENGVLGMEEGESREISVPPEEAYGDRQDALVRKFPRDQLPPSINPEIGQRLQMRRADGETVEVFISDLDEESVTIDANHPLAGKTLHFEIRLVGIGE